MKKLLPALLLALALLLPCFTYGTANAQPEPEETPDIPIEYTEKTPKPEGLGKSKTPAPEVSLDAPIHTITFHLNDTRFTERSVPVESSAGEADDPSPESQDPPADAIPTSFSLLDHIFAFDEANNHVPVTILDDGGFNLFFAGAYTVTFFAVHPVSGEGFVDSSVFTVRTQKFVDAELRVLQGSSNSRFVKYQKYLDGIQAELQTIMQALNVQFAQRAALICSAFPDDLEITSLRGVYAEQDTLGADAPAQYEYASVDAFSIGNWSQILPVFVARSALQVDNPLDLYNLRTIPLDDISDVFWDMHEWRFENDGAKLKLILTELSSTDMIKKYEMDSQTLGRLEELMQPEFQMLFASLTGDYSFSELPEAQLDAIRAALPEGLQMQRESVVLTAHSLVGQVTYFWGGKYNELGFNPMWGVPRLVTSPNTETYGDYRPFGLDCSGFVSWVFINAAKDPSVIDVIRDGTMQQWNNSSPLGWDEALPGDLAFKAAPGRTATNHVGIVVEKREDGSYLVAHCSSSQNAVIISEAWESEFRYMRRPLVYEGENAS